MNEAPHTKDTKGHKGPKTRGEIIAEARRQREEIAQYFRDVEHWNAHCRKEGEAEIEADPDGTMTRLAKALDACLENEARIAAEQEPDQHGDPDQEEKP